MKKITIGKFHLNNLSSLYLYAVIVGVAAGIAAMGFSYLLHLAEDFVKTLYASSNENNLSLNDKLGNALSNPINSITIIVLPAVGGLVAGIIAYFFSRDSVGTGTDEMINAFHNNEGKISAKVPFFKSVATIFTLSTGGSGGKEGPISQVGAGIGVIVANFVKAGSRARRTLLLSGTAAGLGAIFKAPLGGALTAVEMVYKEDLESDALIPAFLSSVTAYLIYTFYTGTDSFMKISELSTLHVPELWFYIILGILCFVFGFLFMKGFKDARSFIASIKIHPIIKPAIGGLLVGLLSLFFFEVSGTGANFLEDIIMGKEVNYFSNYHSQFWIVCSLLLIAFLKIVSTTLTIGSGGSAGIFGPSLFVGGMLGAAVGTFAQQMLPQYDIRVASYIVVGMGAFYAGVASAPIAGIVMICEMTGSYVLLPQLILVSIFTFILAKRISLYKSQVENRFKSPAHTWDMQVDLLDAVNISEQFKTPRNFATITKNIKFKELQQLAANLHSSDFVVVDENNQYVGMLSLRTIKPEVIETITENCGIENHINKEVPSINFHLPVSSAMKVIVMFDVDKVAIEDEGVIIGYLRYRDIFNLYQQAGKRNKES
ncbi:MAG: chloride channel protein [Bacteroidota bacterium]